MDKVKKYKIYRNSAINEITVLRALADRVKTDKSIRTLFKVRCEELDSIKDEFTKQHNCIISTLLTLPDEDAAPEDAVKEAFLAEFYAVKAVYMEFIDDVVNTTQAPVSFLQTSTNYSKVKLPKIELKKFYGEYKNFPSFIDHFNSVIHNNDTLSNVDKFDYLISALQGPASGIVRTLKVTDENYEIAYNALNKRYSNRRLCAQDLWYEIDGTSRVNGDCSSSIRKLLDTFEENIASLKSMNFPTDEWDFMLVMMLLKRLDDNTVTMFEMKHCSSEVPTFSVLVEFLNDRCVTLDTLKISRTQSKKAIGISNTRTYNSPARITSLFANKSPASNCLFCQESHSLYTCPAFANKLPSERYNFCKNKHLCFNCLSRSHDLNKCRSTACCKKCSSRSHHTLLHFDKNPAVGGSGATSSTTTSVEIMNANQDNSPHLTATSILAASNVTAKSHNVLLATALIDISNNSGNYQTFRCLIDSGSMSSFITKRVVMQLGLPKKAFSIEVKALGSMKSSTSEGQVSLSFKPSFKNEPIFHTDAIILDKICDNFPNFRIEYKSWNHILNLQLADPKFYCPGNIDILLGADVFSQIILNGKISGKCDEPYALNTVLGYILIGKTNNHPPAITSSFFCEAYAPNNVEKILKSFWEVESVPDTPHNISDDIACEKSFVDNVTRDETGRYIVALPLKNETVQYQDFQRIIWRFDPKLPLQDYRLRTVTYGMNCSPFLALRTLEQLVKDEGGTFPLASLALSSTCYIDDFVMSIPTFEKAHQLKTEIITLLRRGGFELRKWSSNDLSLLSDLPPSYLSNEPHTFSEDIDSCLKILGLRWNPSADCFSFIVSAIPNRPCTKRTILSELARIYDPLGFISPVTFFCKHLIQQLWLSGIGWDDIPNNEIIRIWNQYQTDLPVLSSLKIPRMFTNSQAIAYEIHGFSDASEKGYACVIYLRSFDANGLNHVSFVCGKSKVAPTKKITIPRLELCAAVLLTKLISSIIYLITPQLNLKRVYCWSDSQIVLYWIKGHPHRWKTFVSNRVTFIREKVAPEHWYYLDTTNNPADAASRGLLPRQMISHSMWFTGPPFLKKQDEWPNSPSLPPAPPVEEEKSIPVFLTSSNDHVIDILLETHSCFRSLQNVLVYLLRFINNSKKPSQKFLGSIVPCERHNALVRLVRHVQSIHFSVEIESKRFSKPLRKLQVFLDSEGILRVGGRLKHASLSHSAKYPMLLPRSSRLTILLIKYFHEKFFHAGFRTTHFLLSQQFWILSPERAINSVLSQCIPCWKQNPKTFQPLMGNLPISRVSQVKPFSHSGVDYGGPFSITLSRHRGVKTIKAYLCIFVCFATKAVHLELASDLSTDSFLAALQRFIARRGRVSHIYSDCGTNFLGAQGQLLRLLESSASHENIVFHPTPASAPHFNGLCEAGVKSVKSHLARVIGQQILTYEEFYTVLTLIESILNSRPLTPMSADVDDLNTLTPGHFLTMKPVSSLPLPDYSDVPLNRLTRWQLLQRLHRDFWHRWHKEYLHTLQQRGRWFNGGTSPRIGTLVLIKTDNLPPCKWSLGRISKLHFGDDQVARVATIKTTHGTLKRPLVKLCPLPLE
ncbi:uncharacterized protein [Leptinotarsa decemlineata]|uniref:uncharacterized protein n=1 Tax=Leptinotarsa decemlineata TaxID=7539 RepID=UPI003D306FA3